ncbi:Ribosomal protein lysine methyltransferase [Saxophila tyrrhenica]|uniref:Ribosomal protein lysine methyltransferase n=1 Tax=Saxophila tyrrhenica TaxID=1690608 RepID=A0AAV9NWY4_9PEZI|nr:Ribosomal protein lysine methyltransferase [Saxophila tyrrhenica]
MDELMAALVDEVEDVDEETFHVFFQNHSSTQDLGMLDPRAEEVELAINGRDFTIKQSPGVLQSKREGGTTGAAVWRACLVFAEWLAWAKNPLFSSDLLTSESVTLELGSGISGVVPLIASPRVGRVVATDQQYALKLLQENITNNLPAARPKSPKGHTKQQHAPPSNIDVLALDWETSDIPAFLSTQGLRDGVDAVLMCDCIYNYALIKPLVQTCVEICRARSTRQSNIDEKSKPTICLIAQQLRQPDVFEQWLQAFMASLRVWRVPDGMLTNGLKEGSGYVVHVGLLRDK